MRSISLRRSRTVTSDDEEEIIRPGTPSSVGINDSKRARFSLENRRTPSASRLNDDASEHVPGGKRRRAREIVERNGDSTPKSKHQPGSIVRIKLTNFVTYTSAEFFPGPNLNMVIGPNGTGKSTVVSAICLGLGWGTQHLGRAKDVSEFVKNGCSEATIEIELQRPQEGQHSDQNPVITRLIKREGNKSTFTINGSQSSNKEVLKLARSMSIQIDNLCQFLPQDRVVEFANMTPVQLLESTQLAAAPSTMTDFHNHLKILRSEQKEMLGNTRGEREQLANLQNRQEMQRADVERMKQRDEIKQRIEFLEKCKPVPRYAGAKRQYQAAKDRQKQLAVELRSLEEELGPALRRVNEKERYAMQVRKLKDQRTRAIENGEKSAQRLGKGVGELEDKMKAFDNTHEAEIKAVKGKKEEQKRIQQIISRLKKQMEEEPEAFNPREVNAQIQQKVDRNREIDEKKREIDEQGLRLRTSGQEKKRNAERTLQQMESLDTQTGQQESKLQKVSRDTYETWQWIKENQDKFEQRVYGPPIVECSLKDLQYADAIEIILQANDFKIITLQNTRDFKILQKYTSEKGFHDISLRVCSIDNLEKFQSPVSNEELHALGLEGWALDYLKGPPTVLAMLCMDKFLHQTAISLQDIPDGNYDRIANSPLSGFVAGNRSYRFTRRREYGSAGITANAKPLRTAEVWTNKPVNLEDKSNLRRLVNELQSDIDEIKKELESLKKERDTLTEEKKENDEEIDTLRHDKEERQRALMAFKALPVKLNQQEEKLNIVNENIAGVRQRLQNIQEQKDEVLLKKTESTLQYAAAVAKLRSLYSDLLEAEVYHIEAVSDVETLRTLNEDVKQLLMRRREEEKEAREEAEKAVGIAKGFGSEVRKLVNEAQRLAAEGNRTLTQFLEECSGKSVEDLDADIDSEKAKLDLMHGGNEGMIQEFEERAVRIEKLRKRLEDSTKQENEINAAIAEVRGKWEPKLDALVAKISDAFSDSFARIGCAGQVTVYKTSSTDGEDGLQRSTHRVEEGGDGLDFANWAIHISVKFRESEPLSLLDSHRQSGGERAVSTIFYLMALQSLSRAPFRVVDEINQGMDPRNERMVHGRMVDMACGSAEDDETGTGSQYFLVTPKLLSGLKYRKGMRVLCIVSGENVLGTEEGQPSKVDFGMWVQRARELGLRNVGKRVDSGMHLGSSFEDRSPSQSQLTEVGA